MNKIITAFLLVSSLALAIAAAGAEEKKPELLPLQPKDVVDIKLTVEQWGIVLTGLSQVPYKDAAPLISEIQVQAESQRKSKKDK